MIATLSGEWPARVSDWNDSTGKERRGRTESSLRIVRDLESLGSPCFSILRAAP